MDTSIDRNPTRLFHPKLDSEVDKSTSSAKLSSDGASSRSLQVAQESSSSQGWGNRVTHRPLQLSPMSSSSSVQQQGLGVEVESSLVDSAASLSGSMEASDSVSSTAGEIKRIMAPCQRTSWASPKSHHRIDGMNIAVEKRSHVLPLAASHVLPAPKKGLAAAPSQSIREEPVRDIHPSLFNVATFQNLRTHALIKEMVPPKKMTRFIDSLLKFFGERDDNSLFIEESRSTWPFWERVRDFQNSQDFEYSTNMQHIEPTRVKFARNNWRFSWTHAKADKLREYRAWLLLPAYDMESQTLNSILRQVTQVTALDFSSIERLGGRFKDLRSRFLTFVRMVTSLIVEDSIGYSASHILEKQKEAAFFYDQFWLYFPWGNQASLRDQLKFGPLNIDQIRFVPLKLIELMAETFGGSTLIPTSEGGHSYVIQQQIFMRWLVTLYLAKYRTGLFLCIRTEEGTLDPNFTDFFEEAIRHLRILVGAKKVFVSPYPEDNLSSQHLRQIPASAPTSANFRQAKEIGRSGSQTSTGDLGSEEYYSDAHELVISSPAREQWNGPKRPGKKFTKNQSSYSGDRQLPASRKRAGEQLQSRQCIPQPQIGKLFPLDVPHGPPGSLPVKYQIFNGLVAERVAHPDWFETSTQGRKSSPVKSLRLSLNQSASSIRRSEQEWKAGDVATVSSETKQSRYGSVGSEGLPLTKKKEPVQIKGKVGIVPNGRPPFRASSRFSSEVSLAVKKIDSLKQMPQKLKVRVVEMFVEHPELADEFLTVKDTKTAKALLNVWWKEKMDCS